METAPKRAFYLGRYNCVERLGEGPLGETFRAKIYGVAGFEKQFAVKRLRPALCEDEVFIARFVNAATAYAGLDHERIARVHEVNVQGSQYYLAIDLVRGIDLARLLEVLHGRGETVPTDVALLVALDLTDALGYAHARADLLPSGVLHLGLTPASVMITTDGELKLLDLGLLAPLVRPGWADSDALMPTLSYLAPEQLRAETLDARADVFALGAMLHEMLSGARAFPGAVAAEVRQRIEATPPDPPAADARLQALLIQMLQPTPEGRTGSIAEVREALVPILGSRANRARVDLGALVRRLARPQTRTGTFPVVATPAPGPPPPPPSALTHNPAWLPPPRGRVPTPPKGPQLSGVPSRNTYSGMGADDQVLVPIELVELPGTPTAREMPAVQPTDDAPARPLEKSEPEEIEEIAEILETTAVRPRNGSTSELYSTHEEADTTAAFRKPGGVEEPGHTEPDANPFAATFQVPPEPPVPAAEPKPLPATAAEPSPGSFVPAPLELPPLPEEGGRSVKLALALGVAAALAVAGGIYLAMTHSGGEPAVEPPAHTTAAPPVPTPPAPAPAPAPSAVAPLPAPAAAPPAPTPIVPPSAPVGPGNLAITTTPPGATVFVDGEPRGAAPLKLDLPAGKHKIVVLGDGSKLRKETVTIGGAVTQLDLTLEAAPAASGAGGLKVRCKSHGEVRILVDGADTGRQCPNEERIPIAPGPHTIGLYSPRTDQTYEVDREIPEDGDHSTRVYVKY